MPYKNKLAERDYMQDYYLRNREEILRKRREKRIANRTEKPASKRSETLHRYYEKHKSDGRFDQNRKYLAPQFSFDQVDGWDGRTNNTILHHRLGELMSMDDLKAIGKYYGCPPCELCWVSTAEHNKIHHCI